MRMLISLAVLLSVAGCVHNPKFKVGPMGADIGTDTYVEIEKPDAKYGDSSFKADRVIVTSSASPVIDADSRRLKVMYEGTALVVDSLAPLAKAILTFTPGGAVSSIFDSIFNRGKDDAPLTPEELAAMVDALAKSPEFQAYARGIVVAQAEAQSVQSKSSSPPDAPLPAGPATQPEEGNGVK